MIKSDPEKPRITANDQKILKKLIVKGRTPDTALAKEMGLSQQAVFKIRNKLENLGIIRGYTPIVDFKKLGVGLITVLGVKINPIIWKKYSEDEVAQKLRSIPYIFQAYRIPSSDISHMLMLGFGDIKQRDNFMKKLETVYASEIDLAWIYTFSVDNVITNEPLSLLYQIIDNKYFKFEELF